MDVEEWVVKAEAEIANHDVVGHEHARAAADEIALEAERSALKARLADALLGTDNPKTRRPHSAESAKEAAVVSEEYLLHVAKLSETVEAKNNAETEKYSARLRARLAIAVIESEAVLRAPR